MRQTIKDRKGTQTLIRTLLADQCNYSFDRAEKVSIGFYSSTKTQLLTTINSSNFHTITATEIPLIFDCTDDFSTDKPLKYSGSWVGEIPVTSYQLPFPACF